MSRTYIFARDGENWVEEAILPEADYDGSVCISGSFAAIGIGYNPSYEAGAVVWAKGIGGCINVTINGMVLDRNDGLYITGRANSGTSFSGLVWPGYGQPPFNDSELFVTKYNTGGDPLRVQYATFSGWQIYEAISNDIAVDEQANIYITGRFNGDALTFGNVTLDPDNKDFLNNVIFVAS